MISTSSHKQWNSDKYKTYAISGNRGKDADYQGDCYPILAPKLSFWKIWHDNIGKVSEEENNKYYVQEYWNQVLSKLDPEKVYRELDNSILLCYENNDEFCHRHIVAAWFEILLGIKIPEIKSNEYKLQEIERPEYIKQYLDDAMRLNRNMRGFNSLRALYLFEKGEKLEYKADELEKKTGKSYDGYRQTACFLRCDADMVEEEYNKEQELSVKNISKEELFLKKIEEMKNHHVRDGVTESEKMGTIEDYSLYQEKQDLENYRFYMNSSASDCDGFTGKKMCEQLKIKNLTREKD